MGTMWGRQRGFGVCVPRGSKREGLVRHGWHVCGGCLSCEVSVFWL